MSSAPSAAPEPEPLSIPHPPQHGLALLDQCIIGGYLIFAVLLGCYFSRSNNTTEAFFLGSRGLPGWALGLSLLSTSISSNSFLAIPAFSYANDFSLLLKDAVLPIPAVVAALLVVPFFRQEGRAGRWQGRQPWGRGAEQKPWGTAFEFLEDRFGSLTRRYAGLCYICVQMVRTASILYLISIPGGFHAKNDDFNTNDDGFHAKNDDFHAKMMQYPSLLGSREKWLLSEPGVSWRFIRPWEAFAPWSSRTLYRRSSCWGVGWGRLWSLRTASQTGLVPF